MGHTNELEHPMFRTLCRTLSFAALLGLTPFALASPCELERGPTGGYRVSEDCELLRERFAEVRDDIKMRVGPVVMLDLPDLVPIDGDFELLFGETDLFSLEIKIANQGVKDSASFEVQALVEVYNNGYMILSETRWVSFANGLAAGDDQREIFPQPIHYSPSAGDYVVFTFFTDARQAQTGGKIWESNEQNNVGEERCRINSLSAADICDDGAMDILSP
jgi:hypothetical protein